MAFLSFLFGKSTKIENDFFGQMLFLEDKKDTDKSYFECRRNFTPSDKTIEIGIDGDISGPTQIQVDFFKRIERNYQNISPSIIALIEEEFRNWNNDFKIINFEKEFKPVYLKIPRCETKPIIWEIVFESEHGRNHTFTLTMYDYEAKEFLIDG